MLHLILGRAGTGKSSLITDKFCTLVKNGEKGLFLVPEQFTVTVENAVTEKTGGFFGTTEVLNFKRLCNKIFTACGGLAATYIDDGGRAVVMAAALESVKDSLNVYSKTPYNSDFISLLLAADIELKAYRISADTLSKKAYMINNDLQSQRLQEISLILKAYDSLLKGNFDDPLEDIDKAVLLLKENRIFSGYTVFLDSYKGFTPQEYSMIAELLRQTDDAYISLTCDGVRDTEGGYGLFSAVKATAIRLKSMAQKLGIPVCDDVLLSDTLRFNSSEVKALESELFSTSPEAYSKSTEDIVLYSGKDLFSEAEFAAKEISWLVREKGLKYGDIVVITRSLEDYKGILDIVFESYEIPLFMDNRTGLSHKPLMLFVSSALNVINYGFSTDYIFNYLKTGLAGFETQDICELENYVYIWNISGRKWTENDWNYNPDGFSGEITEQGKMLIDKFNDMRMQIINPLAKLKEDLRSGTISEKCKALYSFLIALNIPQKLEADAADFKDRGEYALSEEQEQIWDIFIKALDQISVCGGNFYADTLQFANLLELVLSGCDIGIIPTSKDEVLAGSADRIRSMKPKCVFVLGLNDGIFPMIYKDSGLITDADRRALSELDIELAPTCEYKSCEEPYFAYTAFTLPSDRLYLCYHKTGLDGKESRPSVIISDIKKVFEDLTEKGEDKADALSFIQRKKPAFEYLMGNGLKNNQDVNLTALKDYFESDEEYSPKIKSATALYGFGKKDRITDANLAAELFSENLYISPTRVESYYNCSFKHFCEYGLGLRPQRKAELNAMETGTFIHHALEQIIKESAKDGKALWDLTPKELTLKARRLSVNYLNEYMGGIDTKSARFKYLFRRLCTTVETLLTSLAAEFKNSEFVMTDFELKIGKNQDISPLSLKLTDGNVIEVYGKADRVDTCRIGEDVYIRVVDYKTGSKKFKLNDVLNGLSLQMLIYLFTICENGKERYGGNTIPAGILYFPAKDPVFTLKRHLSQDEIKAKRQDDLKQNGLLLGDAEVLDKMEKGLNGIYIPVKLNKNSTFNSNSQIATLEQLGKLKKYIEKLLCSLGNELKRGNISINPIKDTAHNSCRFCDMLPVCGYEPGRSRKRIYKRIKKKEFFDKLDCDT